VKKFVIAIVVSLVMLFSTVIASAAPDSAVILINPVSNSTVYSNNLLISVKITQPKTIKVRVYEENTSNSTPVLNGANFTTTNNLSFYTKQINNVSPGLYRIRIDTIDSTGTVTHTSTSYVAVKERSAAADAKVFEAPQSGTLQFLQNVIKTIFGN